MLMMIIILHTNKKSAAYLKLIKWKYFASIYYKKLISIGLPSSFQSLFEISSFAIAAFIAGMHSYLDTSAHSVSINMASMTFQVCTGFSVAATVRVAGFYGVKNMGEIRKAGLASLYIVAGFMTLCGIMFIILRDQIPLMFFDKDKIEVIRITSHLLVITSIFQIFDGIQVVCLGSLRGMRDVMIPTIISFIAYMIIAMPLGYYLCINRGMGAVGTWIGLCSGLGFTAVMLLWRFYYLTDSRRHKFI